MYPSNILRCQHLKINGTQCGSPALRNERYCYFHRESSQTFLTVDDKPRARQRVRPRPVHVQLPLLEDANSIQVALMQIMRLVLAGEIEHRTAGLLPSTRCRPRRRTSPTPALSQVPHTSCSVRCVGSQIPPKL